MRRIPFLFFLFLLFGFSAKGQTLTRLQSWGLDFESIFWVDSQTAFAGGENLLAKTTNGGQTWMELPHQFEGRVLDIHFSNSTQGWAVGKSGLFLETTDGGQTWTSTNLSFSGDFYRVKFLGNLGIISAAEGKIYLSTDLGKNWNTVASGSTNDLFGAQIFSENLIFLTGKNGTLLKSQNGGQSFQKLIISTSEDLFAISFTSPLIGYVSGGNGVLFRTQDGGNTWTSLVSGVTVPLRDLATSQLDPRIIAAAGDQGTAIQSNNSGSSFVKVSLGTGFVKNVKGIGFHPNSNTAWICGADGYMASSPNGGRNYTTRLDGYRNHFSGIDFKNENQGFVVGQKGQFLLTSNGGTSFLSRPIPENFDIITLDFWNAAFGYVSGPNGKIYRTTNSGSTWLERSIPSSPQVNGFYLFAPSVLYVAGNSGFVAKSFESGDVWDKGTTTNTTENLKDLMFFDFQFGVAIGENGQLSYSNGGTIWTDIPKITEENLNGLAKLDGLQAIAVGNKGTIVKTSDMGINWDIIPIPYEEDLLSIDFFDSQNGFISGKNGLFLASKDGGKTWTKIPSGTYRDLTSVSVGIPLVAYAAGEDGTIVKYNCVPPTGNLGAISGNTEACLGLETFTIPTMAEAGSEIVWRVDGGEIVSGQGSNSIDVHWTKTGRNGVYVSRANFCGAGETSYLEVQVLGIPPSNLTIQGEGTVCQEQIATYSLPQVMGSTYNWSVTGGELVQGQNTRMIQVKWTSAGSGTLSSELINRCGKSSKINLPVQVLTKPAQPSPIVGETLVAFGVQNYAVDQITGLDYRWTLSEGGKIISGQGTHRIQVQWEKEGKFDLSVEAQNACDFGPKRTLQVSVNIITGFEPELGDGGMRIFPNPSFNGTITIESKNLDQWSSLELVNLLGQSIETHFIRQGDTSLYLENLPRGLIFLQFSGPKGRVQKKVLIH